MLEKSEGKEERKVAAHFWKVSKARMIENRESRSLGSAEERSARRKKKTDARDPAVSEGERGKRGRAEELTRVHAGRGKSRKGKGKKREASRKGKFSVLFLI